MINYFQLIKNELETELNGLSFDIKGILLNDGINFITIGSDSKLIGRIFELFVIPIFDRICSKYGWIFEPTEKQNIYPDFNIVIGNDEYIAIDVKTTYRKKGKIKFTLGSYTSFIRDNKKNIKYNYKKYKFHYVIGFVYDRNEKTTEGKILNVKEGVEVPFNNVEWFFQEKYKISGDKPGSGNTENIGSIESNKIDDFKNGNGLFTKYGNIGEQIFNDYWRNYPKYKDKKYTDIKTYEDFKNKTN